MVAAGYYIENAIVWANVVVLILLTGSELHNDWLLRKREKPVFLWIGHILLFSSIVFLGLCQIDPKAFYGAYGAPEIAFLKNMMVLHVILMACVMAYNFASVLYLTQIHREIPAEFTVWFVTANFCGWFASFFAATMESVTDRRWIGGIALVIMTLFALSALVFVLVITTFLRKELRKHLSNQSERKQSGPVQAAITKLGRLRLIVLIVAGLGCSYMGSQGIMHAGGSHDTRIRRLDSSTYSLFSSFPYTLQVLLCWCGWWGNRKKKSKTNLKKSASSRNTREVVKTSTDKASTFSSGSVATISEELKQGDDAPPTASAGLLQAPREV
jgi:uncharacterized membrane protein